MTFSMQV